jgi:hypothetical protein
MAEPAQLAWRRGSMADSHRHIQPTYHTRRGVRKLPGAEPAQLAWERGPVADNHRHIQPTYHTRRGVRKLPGAGERQSLLSSPGGVALWQTVTVIYSPPTTYAGGEKTTRGRACSARLWAWPCGRQSLSYPAHLPHTEGVRKLPREEERQSLLSSPGGVALWQTVTIISSPPTTHTRRV